MAQRLDGHMLERRIRVAMGAVEADLALKQATVPNLFTNGLITADVAIADGYVAGIGEYAGHQEIDCRGRMPARRSSTGMCTSNRPWPCPVSLPGR